MPSKVQSPAKAQLQSDPTVQPAKQVGKPQQPAVAAAAPAKKKKKDASGVDVIEAPQAQNAADANAAEPEKLDAADEPVWLSRDQMRAKVKDERKSKPAITPSDFGQSVGIGLAGAGPIFIFMFIAGAGLPGAGIAMLGVLVALFAVSMGARLIMRHRNEQAAIERETEHRMKEQEKEKARYEERAKDKAEQAELQKQVDANAERIEAQSKEIADLQAQLKNAQAAPAPAQAQVAPQQAQANNQQVQQLQQQLQQAQQQQAQNLAQLAQQHQQQMQHMQQQLLGVQAQQAQRQVPPVQQQRHAIPPVQHMLPPIQQGQQAQVQQPIGRLGLGQFIMADPVRAQKAEVVDGFRERVTEMLAQHEAALAVVEREKQALSDEVRGLRRQMAEMRTDIALQEVTEMRVSDLEKAQAVLQAEQDLLARQYQFEQQVSPARMKMQRNLERMADLAEERGRLDDRIANAEKTLRDHGDSITAALQGATLALDRTDQLEQEMGDIHDVFDSHQAQITGVQEEMRQGHSSLSDGLDSVQEELDSVHDVLDSHQQQITNLQQDAGRFEREVDDRLVSAKASRKGLHEARRKAESDIRELQEGQAVMVDRLDITEQVAEEARELGNQIAEAFKVDQTARQNAIRHELSVLTRTHLMEINICRNNKDSLDKLIKTIALDVTDPYQAILQSQAFTSKSQETKLDMLEEMVMHKEVAGWRSNAAYYVSVDTENPGRAGILNNIIDKALTALPQEPGRITNADRYLLAKVVERYIVALENDNPPLDIQALKEEDAQINVVAAVMKHLVQEIGIPMHQKATFTSIVSGAFWGGKKEVNQLLLNLLTDAVETPGALRAKPLAQDIAHVAQYGALPPVAPGEVGNDRWTQVVRNSLQQNAAILHR